MTPAALLTLLLLHSAPAELRVGQWVTYELRRGEGEGRASYWRIAVVGQERDNRGREGYWLEMEVGTHPEFPAPMAQLRMLVAKGAGVTAQGVTRLLMAQGFDRPVEVDPGAIAAFVPGGGRPARSSPLPAAARPVLRAGRHASLLTRAGSVRATSLEVLERGVVVQRLWVSPEVPVLHLARIEIPPIGQVMEVHGHGEDARPRMRLPSSGTPTIHLDGYNGGDAEDEEADDGTSESR